MYKILAVFGIVMALTMTIGTVGYQHANALSQSNTQFQGLGGDVGDSTSGVCSHSGAAAHNPHCNGGTTPTGQTISNQNNQNNQ
jgi:hypothetical protein